MEYLDDANKGLIREHSFRSAILRDDRAGIEGFIDRGETSLDQPEARGLFIAAACRSNSALVKYLFTKFSIPVDYELTKESDYYPFFGVTALWTTIMWGKNRLSKEREEQKKIVAFLLAHKANPDRWCYHTSSMTIIGDCPKFMPLTIVIQKYAEALSGKNKHCYDLQMNRALANHYGEIALQLLQAGANPDLPNSDKQTAFDYVPDSKIKALLQKFSKRHGEGKGKEEEAGCLNAFFY